MNVVEAIYARRAVRAYQPRMVDEPTLRLLLAAAVQAPSAMNQQPWLFSVVQDTAQLKRYSDRAKEMLLSATVADAKGAHYRGLLETPSFNIFYDAATLVVISVSARGPYSDADCWLAAENLMLAACDSGLGSCCIGFAVPVLNEPEVKAELGLGPSAVAIAPIILGYPATATANIARGAPNIVAWMHAK